MKILITGASSGIGAEFARQYAKAENELFLLARRGERLSQLKSQLDPYCKSIELLVVDVTEFEPLQTALEELGALDLIILNAGISLGHDSIVADSADAKRIYDVNLLSQHTVVATLLPKMLEAKSGHIVFISSLAALFTMPTATLYASSKRALNAYAEGIAYAYHSEGIAVTTIMPGFIRSELTDKNNFAMPLFLETDVAVAKMRRAIAKKKPLYAFPWPLYWLMRGVGILPFWMRVRIVSWLQKGSLNAA